MKLRISASGLKVYSDCQEKFRLSRLYRLKESHLPPWLEAGIIAHEIMAGKNHDNVSTEVEKLVTNLKQMEKAMGFKIIDREVKQEFSYPGLRGVDVIRYIDAYGYDKNGKAVLIDYKTVRTPPPWQKGPPFGWQPVDDLPPAQARGWQSAMYLLPPSPSVDHPFAEWPKIIYFLVTSSVGPIGAHAVTWSQEREDELTFKVTEVRDFVKKYKYDYAPRNFSAGCNFCDFVPVCYRRPGAMDRFDKRENEHDEKLIE
jgi:hypothetical protein